MLSVLATYVYIFVEGGDLGICRLAEFSFFLLLMVQLLPLTVFTVQVGLGFHSSTVSGKQSLYHETARSGGSCIRAK